MTASQTFILLKIEKYHLQPGRSPYMLTDPIKTNGVDNARLFLKKINGI